MNLGLELGLLCAVVLWAGQARPAEALDTPATRELAECCSSRSYFPLVEKARWRYRIRQADGKEGEEFELVARGLTQSVVHSGSIFVVDEISGDRVSPAAYLVEDGFVYRLLALAYDRSGQLFTIHPGSRYAVLPLYPKKGMTWKEAGPVLNAEVSVEAAIDEVAAVADVPAGRFLECLRVHSSLVTKPRPALGQRVQGDHLGVRFEFDDWYAKGVGLVRSVFWTPDRPTARQEIVLESYEVPAGAAPVGPIRAENEK